MEIPRNCGNMFHMGHVGVDESLTCQFSLTCHIFAYALVNRVVPGHDCGYPVFYIYGKGEREIRELAHKLCVVYSRT